MPKIEGIYDTAITGKIIEGFRKGYYTKTVLESAGLGIRQFKRWMAYGKAGRSPYYRKFYLDVLAAKAEAEHNNVDCVQKAAKTTWQAAAWLLERRTTARWGRKDRSELVVTSNKPKDLGQVVTQIRQVLGQNAAQGNQEPEPVWPPEGIAGRISGPEPPELPEDSYGG
jgi:hypothetical protein